MSSLKRQTFNTLFWSAIERISVQGIQFVLTLVIARLVLPSDYGLIAMVGIFLAIAQTFIDSGFSNALIQKQNRTEIDYATVFYFSVVVGLIVYFLLYLSAPFIASFYNEQMLVPVTRIIGLTLIVTSFSVVQRARLTINLDFKRQAFVSSISVIVSGVLGIYLAYVGYGVWALVYQTLLNSLISTILLGIYAKWMPKWKFSWDSFGTLFSFGSKLLLSGLLHTIYTNLYSLVIGKKFSATDLGYYNRAYTIAYFPSNNISNIIVRAIYPIQCQIQDDDKELIRTFLQYIAMSAFIVFPLMIGLFVLAKSLILFFLTDKWLPAVPILQIMCIAYMWDTIMTINGTILKVKGRTDYYFKAEVIKKIAAITILLLTVPFGIIVMCVGLIIYSFIDIFIISRYVRKLISCTLKMQIKVIFPSLFLSVVMGGIIYVGISFFSVLLTQLIIGILLGIVTYIGLSVIFRMKEILIIKSVLLHK